MQRLGIFFCSLLVALCVSSLAMAEIEVVEDCSFEDSGAFEDRGKLCESSNGLYGTCRELGPNSCAGEHPDFPGQCKGFPNCSATGCSTEKERGDHCQITQPDSEIDGTCQLRCDMTGEDCSADEPLFCDISDALGPANNDEDNGDGTNGDEDNGDEDNGDSTCATVAGGPETVVLLLGFLLALTARRRVSPVRK